MTKNVNCRWNDRGAWCTNKKVKRSLFGIGARCCIEHDNNKTCQFKDPWQRPTGPPPPPSPRPPKKTDYLYAQYNTIKNMLEIIIEKNKKLEECKEENKKLKKELDAIFP